MLVKLTLEERFENDFEYSRGWLQMGQFHQSFMSTFYTLRSQKHKKDTYDLTVFMHFCDLH